MTTHEFKIWLATHGYTQKALAQALEITEPTITTYNRNGRYPRIFVLALKGLAS